MCMNVYMYIIHVVVIEVMKISIPMANVAMGTLA